MSSPDTPEAARTLTEHCEMPRSDASLPPATRRPVARTPLSRRRARHLAAALAITLPHGMIGAQGSTSSPVRFETFAARNESAASTLFGGLSLSGHSGLLGLRVGGSVAGFSLSGDNDRITTAPVRVCSPRGGCRTATVQRYGSGSLFDLDAWTADADLMIEPFRTTPVLRQLLLGFSPYAFAGVGRYRASATSLTGDTSRAVWSYGAGVHHELISRIGVTGEARVRRTLDDNAFIGGTFRNAVQYRLGLSVGVGGGASRRKSQPPVTIVSRGPIPGSTPAPAPAPVPLPAPVAAEVDDRSAATVVATLLDEADGLVDRRWRAGGTVPDDGFDAGGFVQYVFAQQDIALPRLVRDLAATGVGIAPRVGVLRPGDLLVFANDGSTPDHVAIYVGRDRFIHASASAGTVRYDVLGEGERGAWFAEHLVAVRRVIGTQGSTLRAPTPALTPSGRADGAPRPSGAP